MSARNLQPLGFVVPLLGLVPVALLGLAACAGPRAPEATAEARPADAVLHEAEHPEHAAPTDRGHGGLDVPVPAGAARAAEPGAEPPNRDKHGAPNVGRYIENLRSEARVEELQVPAVVAALELAPYAVVADIGCGPGVFALPFAAAVPEGLVYAVDVEPRQLDEVRALLLAREVGNVIPVLASYENPHLPPHGVDLIFIGDTYHHFEERVAYLRVLARDLAPGGRLALLEYKPGDIPVGPPASHKLAPGVMEAELAEAGFVPAASFDFHRWHDFTVWKLRER